VNIGTILNPCVERTPMSASIVARTNVLPGFFFSMTDTKIDTETFVRNEFADILPELSPAMVKACEMWWSEHQSRLRRDGTAYTEHWLDKADVCVAALVIHKIGQVYNISTAFEPGMYKPDGFTSLSDLITYRAVNTARMDVLSLRFMAETVLKRFMLSMPKDFPKKQARSSCGSRRCSEKFKTRIAGSASSLLSRGNGQAMIYQRFARPKQLRVTRKSSFPRRKKKGKNWIGRS
jgi:hypothetical protein